MPDNWHQSSVIRKRFCYTPLIDKRSENYYKYHTKLPKVLTFICLWVFDTFAYYQVLNVYMVAKKSSHYPIIKKNRTKDCQ